MRAWIRRSTVSLVRAFGSAKTFWRVMMIAGACSFLVGSQKLQPSDDAYITFRHAKNLAVSGRPAWNLSGRPVLGSTTPGFMFGLGSICKVLGVKRIDHAALYVNAALHFLIVLFTYLVANDLLHRVLPSILAALLVGVNAVNVYVASQGFESALLTATLLAGLYFVRAGRGNLSVGLASFAPLIRPEGVLLTALVWGAILLRKRFRPRLLLAGLPVPILWLTFSTTYYG